MLGAHYQFTISLLYRIGICICYWLIEFAGRRPLEVEMEIGCWDCNIGFGGNLLFEVEAVFELPMLTPCNWLWYKISNILANVVWFVAILLFGLCEILFGFDGVVVCCFPPLYQGLNCCFVCAKPPLFPYKRLYP